jgi:hypothetical protein
LNIGVCDPAGSKATFIAGLSFQALIKIGLGTVRVFPLEYQPHDPATGECFCGTGGN